MRAKVSQVLSLSCKLAVGGNTTVDAIMMLIDVIPPRLSRFLLVRESFHCAM
ncbi:MAG: hypothetical protein IJ433_01410 [Ruminococcus sp.]|nr:hypothetical protein [Ruminococcus sp.]